VTPVPDERVVHTPGTFQRYRAWLVAGAVVALCGYLAYVARAVFTPLLAAMAIAYILNPVVDWVHRKGVPRPAAIAALFLLLAAVVISAGALVLFYAIDQVSDLAAWLNDKLPTLFDWLGRTFPQASREFLTKLKDTSSQHVGQAVQYVTNTTAVVLGSLWTVANLVVLIPLYTFFFLWRFDRVLQFLAEIIPLRYRDRAIDIARQIDATLASFFRGRLIICSIVGAATTIGYLIAAVPFAIPLGLLIGVLNLVPFLAAIVGLPITLAICYLHYLDFAHPIYALIVFLIVQALDNFLLSPIQGKSVGLHPITTIVVLLIGSELAGLFGLLLAIPAAAVVKNLFRELILPELSEITGPVHRPPPPDQREQTADASEN